MLEQARAYVDERKYLHAAQIYNRLTSLSPSMEAAWVELSHVYSELNQYDAAGRILQRAAESSGDPNKILFLLGSLHQKTGEFDQALASYKRLLLQERVLSRRLRSHLHFNIALCYFSKNNLRLAESHFRKVKRVDPHFPKIHESLGELLLRRGAVTESITILKHAIAQDPYSWIGHYLLGLAFSRLREWNQAYEEFVSAIEMDPNEPNGWHMCGEALLSLERYDEAEQYLRKALDLNPHLTDAIANVGFLYMRRGEIDTAFECFERALALEPENAKALQGREQIVRGSRPGA
ncbi:MAG: tetratricopeptide repeat protein [Ignavibacteriales bacterium]|nr:tetratricopeptide repeat protein [Ignavibacteriales bacterium]